MRTKSNLKDWPTKIKDALLGTDPDDRKLMAFLYILGTFIYVSVLIPLMAIGSIAAAVNNIEPEVRWLVIIAMYFGFMGAIRLILAATNSARSFYLGHNTDEIQADDFSDIEALVARGKYVEAINRYRHEYSERGGEDERPRLRIAEIYRLEMCDYKAALNQYALIARTSNDNAVKLQAYTHLLELFRDKFPNDKRFELLCKKIMVEYPGTVACRLASEQMLNRAKNKGGA